MTNDSFGCASENEMFQSGISASGKDDQINLDVAGETTYFLGTACL